MIITEQDFDQLTTNSMKWGPDWATQADRFEVIDDMGPLLFSDALMAYWTNTYAEVMFCRSFLLSQGFASRCFYDTAAEDYLIVTHYMTASWRND